MRKPIAALIPPQEVDLEDAVLSAIISGDANARDFIDEIHPDFFYKEENKRLFYAILELYKSNTAIDTLTVSESLKKLGYFDSIGGYYFVATISNKISSAANIEYHIRIIQELYYKREIIKICSNSISDAYQSTKDVFDIIDDSAKIFTLVSGSIGKTAKKIAEVMPDLIKEFAEPAINGVTGVPSGLRDLDSATGGWQKSDLIIVAGRPAMGKTAFVLTCAKNASLDFEKPVVVFSLEMSTTQLTTRLISSESEVENEAIRKRALQDHQWQKIHQSIGVLEQIPLLIDDTPALTLTQLNTKAKKLKKEQDIQMIIIDYLQLMSGKGEGGNREQEISSISRGLKKLAKELDIPVIALSQLSRAVESRPGQNKRPLLSDLRESGSIEQDADVVIFLFRPEYYGITEDENGNSMEGLGELIIAKNRSGPTKTVPTRFISKFTKFIDLDDYHLDYPSPQFPMHPVKDLNREHFGSAVLRPSQTFDDEAPF